MKASKHQIENNCAAVYVRISLTVHNPLSVLVSKLQNYRNAIERRAQSDPKKLTKAYNERV